MQRQSAERDGEELNLVVDKGEKPSDRKESDEKNSSIDAIDVDIRGGCKEEDSPSRASPVKMSSIMDTAEKAFNEEEKDLSPEKRDDDPSAPTKKPTGF
mmetsp:Transcript_32272/g.49409  ORF Transcript_32272/g.49409 Transcript_32272/m.49409 type:complete len:99 (+) Transcript_32272:749-1045(+)